MRTFRLNPTSRSARSASGLPAAVQPSPVLTAFPIAAALLFGLAGPARADLAGFDRDFVTQAERANIASIQDAQWGEKSPVSQPVKRLAQLIIKNRTNASADLQTLAQNENFSLPPLPAVDQQKEAAELRDKHGTALEKAYAQHEVERHQQQIALYQRELSEGKNQGVRDYAQKNLPMLKNELDLAQKVASETKQ
ncbi:MAG: hypothetical protein BGO51_24145 [Rhodospirillales bacterium 69-11]|nr:DUF4142 domain-containing protein [Rhodospirillales bacterium]OJW22333.1 MAG: hypothetical protein BGO51_24145 [Rhodospirillales bacterium 69-11]